MPDKPPLDSPEPPAPADLPPAAQGMLAQAAAAQSEPPERAAADLSFTPLARRRERVIGGRRGNEKLTAGLGTAAAAVLTEWGAASNPYYEKAMLMRSKENTIYFASVNYALRYQESATSLIDPTGECQAFLPYGQEGVLVQEIDLDQATGLLASRYAPERYQEFTPE